MPAPFDARSHAAELCTVRQLMTVRCARIVEAGGDDAVSQEHVRSLDAVLALLHGRCSVVSLQCSLDRMLAAGREQIPNAELFKLLTCEDA